MTDPATETRGIKIALAGYLILVVVQLATYHLTNICRIPRYIFQLYMI